jgi:hypothetical protein
VEIELDLNLLPEKERMKTLNQRERETKKAKLKAEKEAQKAKDKLEKDQVSQRQLLPPLLRLRCLRLLLDRCHRILASGIPPLHSSQF